MPADRSNLQPSQKQIPSRPELKQDDPNKLQVTGGNSAPAYSFSDSMNRYAGNQGPGDLTFTGSKEEQQGQLAGLNLAKLGYGQDIFQTGADIQRVKELQRQRTAQAGGDPVSAAIMGQKAGAVANAQRNLASQGVKGGVAAGAIDAISRQRDQDIAASLYGQQRQSIADERSLAGNTLSGTVSMMQGERGVGTGAGTPLPPKPQGFFESIFGSIFG